MAEKAAKRVTMAQIAEAAGVSRITVSNILNGRTRGVWKSSAAQIERIQKIARDMGYRPNAAAKAVAHGRFNAIAMVTRTDIGGQQQSLTSGALKAADKLDLNLLYAEVTDEEQITEEGAGLRMLRELSVDGLIVHYGRNIPKRFREVVASYGVPAVWAHTKAAKNCVYPDEIHGAKLAVERLIERGHRRIGYVRGIEHMNKPKYATPHYSEADRETGYSKAMLAHGLKPQIIEPNDMIERNRVHASLAQWINKQKDMDALVCYDGRTGTTMHIASMMSRPVEVLCFYHRSRIEGILQGPAIAIVPLQEVGRSGVSMLNEMIQSDNTQIKSCRVKYSRVLFASDRSAG